MLEQIDLSRADLNLLVLFDIVFDEGCVGRVAARLNLSQSAVSYGLVRLRRLLNYPLFQMRQATLLFADIEGFARLTENTPPEKLVNLLNELFSG